MKPSDDTSKIFNMFIGEASDVARRLKQLQDIAISLSGSTDKRRLLKQIIDSACELLDADAGSIFVKQFVPIPQKDENASKPLFEYDTRLSLEHAVNKSRDISQEKIFLKLENNTLAGFVAVNQVIINIPDAYDIKADYPFKHSTAVDKKLDYRTRSVLAVPMLNTQSETIGVLQLINKKRNKHKLLDSSESFEKEVVQFDDVDSEFAVALASQAAVCLENAILAEQVRQMFNGLLKSLSVVLEGRLYSTYGHCYRVSEYAVRIARAINDALNAQFKGKRFSDDEIMAIRIGAFMHDIGKLNVPEKLIHKVNRLFEEQGQIVEMRFAVLLHQLKAEGKKSELDEARKDMEFVRHANDPRNNMSEADIARVKAIAARWTVELAEKTVPILTPEEVEALTITYGNLTGSERKGIEQHAIESWNILKRVSWPRQLNFVPNIAASHHEKIDGSGYPWKLVGDQIPIEGRITAISDIFEALTAQDRAYKPPFSIQKSLAILQDMVDKGKLDKEIFEVFVKNKIYLTFADDKCEFVKMPKIAQLDFEI